MSGIINNRVSQKTVGSGIQLTIVAAAFGLMWGMDIGAISGALLFLKKVFSLSPIGVSYVTTAVNAGTVVGALTGGIISDKLGRKRTMLWVALIACLTAVLSATSTNMGWLAFVRLVLGYVLGITLVVCPAFISESARTEWRGRLVVVFQMCITTGIAVSYFIDLALTQGQNWRLMLGIPGVVALILVVLVSFVPDTPRWYAMKNRDNEALSALKRIYSDESTATTQLENIRNDLAHQREGSLSELFKRPMLRATIFGLGAGFFLQATGIQAIVYYSPSIIQSLGVNSASMSILFTALFQVLALIAVITALSLIDKVGRRPLMLIGAVAMVVGLATLSVSEFLGGKHPTPVISVFALIGLALFKIGNSGGFGALIYVFATELFPTRLRGKGAAATLFSTQTTQFIVSFAFPPVLAAVGGLATFGGFMVIALGSFFFVYALAPEFKGRSLEEIRTYWDNGGHWGGTARHSEPKLSGKGSNI